MDNNKKISCYFEWNCSKQLVVPFCFTHNGTLHVLHIVRVLCTFFFVLHSAHLRWAHLMGICSTFLYLVSSDTDGLCFFIVTGTFDALRRFGTDVSAPNSIRCVITSFLKSLSVFTSVLLQDSGNSLCKMYAFVTHTSTKWKNSLCHHFWLFLSIS